MKRREVIAGRRRVAARSPCTAAKQCSEDRIPLSWTSRGLTRSYRRYPCGTARGWLSRITAGRTGIPHRRWEFRQAFHSGRRTYSPRGGCYHPAIRMAQAATATTTPIPIIRHDLETDPVASGFIESYARPGGQITGVFLTFPRSGRNGWSCCKRLYPASRVSQCCGTLLVAPHRGKQRRARQTV